jgi:hypothetical protein
MRINISDETVYSLVIDVLKRDYNYLCADITRFQERTVLSDIEQEDLDNWIKYRDTLEVILGYYAGMNWNR